MIHSQRTFLLISSFALALLAPSCRTSDSSASSLSDSELAEFSPARQLLERSLDFHDPERRWSREAIPVAWTSRRPNGDVGFALDIVFGPGGDLSMNGERQGKQLEYRVDNDVVWARVDGVEDIDEELRQKMGLARDNGLFWRDYLGFLAGMPMCLLDPGVQLEPGVIETELEGRPVLALRTTFSEEVGTDLWMYYFDAETAQLVGCRFHRVDPTKDGETLVFEGLTSVDGVRLPRERRWYMNADWKYLGVDELTLSR